MMRTVLMAAVIVFGFAGCGPKPETAAPAPSTPSASSAPSTPTTPSTKSDGSLRPVQSAERPELTAEKISTDIVGKMVDVPEMSGNGPSDQWTFEADEYRRVEIVEKHPTAAGLDLLVFMLTRSNPKPGQVDVQVSGQLRLHYEWTDKQWTLKSIDNVSFRYSLGVAT